MQIGSELLTPLLSRQPSCKWQELVWLAPTEKRAQANDRNRFEEMQPTKVASRIGPLPRPFEFITNSRFARDNGPKLLFASTFVGCVEEGSGERHGITAASVRDVVDASRMWPLPRPFEFITTSRFARELSPSYWFASTFVGCVEEGAGERHGINSSFCTRRRRRSRMGPLPRPFEFITNSRFARDNGPKLLVRVDFCRMCSKRGQGRGMA